MGGKNYRRPAGPVEPSRSAWPKPKVSPLPLSTRLLAYGAILGASILVYLPTLHFRFISWDDTGYVLQNPWIRSWSVENLIHIFTKTYYVSYMPLQLVSYTVDHSLWGLNPFGYHLQEVLLNAINGVLSFIIVRRLFGSVPMALLAALLFAVHPAQVETVAWISSRKEALAATFMLLSLYSYLIARGEKTLRWGPYAASVAFFALAVLAKVSAAVLPLFLLLIDLVYVRGPRRDFGFWVQALGSKVPFGLMGLWVAVMNWISQPRSNATYVNEPSRYLMVKGHAVWKYLELLTGIPKGIPVYDNPHLPRDVPTAIVNLAGLVLLPAIVWFAYRRRARTLTLGTAWLFIMLLPALLFPVVTYVAERYLYTPSLGFCWLMAAGIVALGDRARTPARRVGITLALAAVPLAGFTYRTVDYCRIWANSETFWTYATQHTADFRAWNNLAKLRLDENRLADAERYFATGARQPNSMSFEGLTVVYYKSGRYAEALQTIQKGFDVLAQMGNDPAGRAELYFKRGAVLWMMSRRDEANQSWEETLRLNPEHAGARKALAGTPGH